MPDVLTFGETMLRLSPPSHQRLEMAANLDVWIAGSESNVAAGLCALGLSCTWVSRLPDNAMGRRVAATIAARGVDVSSVLWTSPEERVGLFYAEGAITPRPGRVIYDRANSAAAGLSPLDVPDSLFETHRHLHVSGITLALSASCAETVADAIFRARKRGRTVSLDVNHRAKLWTAEDAAAALSPLIAKVDVLFCGREDAVRLFDCVGDDMARAQGLQEQFGNPIVVLTAGRNGAVGCDQDGSRSVPAVPLETTVDRFGSGDAFAAGFLAGYLQGEALERSLRLGAAAAALKRTIPGDMLVATRAEVESVAVQEEGENWR